MRRRTLLFDALTYVLLIMGTVVMVAPFVWMVSTAFKEPADQFTRALIPNPATLSNFTNLWEALPFSRLIFNSLLIASLTTIGQLLTCAMAAFCLCRRPFSWA